MMDLEEMARVSKVCIDSLEIDQSFPDFAFVLYDGGYFTHHIITQRERAVIKGVSGVGFFRDNHEPSKHQRFDKRYVDMVFDYMFERSRQVGGCLNFNELAVIPFGSRMQEVIALGSVVETRNLDFGVILRIIEYDYAAPGKLIKVYSPPNATIIRRTL